jgi:hypothetical protein
MPVNSCTSPLFMHLSTFYAKRHANNFSHGETDPSMAGRSYEALLNFAIKQHSLQCTKLQTYIWATDSCGEASRANFSWGTGPCKVTQGTINSILSTLTCEGKHKAGEHTFMVDLNFQAFQAPGYLMSVKIQKINGKSQVEVQLFQVTISPTTHKVHTMQMVIAQLLKKFPLFKFSVFWITPSKPNPSKEITPFTNLAPPNKRNKINIKTIAWRPNV